MSSSFERLRDENVRKNRELLMALGLDAPIMPVTAPKSPAKKKAAAPRKSAPAKRRLSDVDGDGEDGPSKAPRVAESPSGTRRSSRNSGRPRVSYTDEIITRTNSPPPVVAKPRRARDPDEDVEGMDAQKEGRAERVGNRLGSRVHNPKTYGAIPGIEVGTWWETRAQCSTDAIHAPFVAGISAGPQGAYSVALSGGYEDDVDLGYAFTYTGSGGRDLKGTPQNRKNLRTAPQSSDQDWENPFNAALKKSAETKKPVRVIRGFKLHSEWAPATGYRYDGLYRVEKAWMEPGLNPGRFKVCKFALKRMDGQAPLPKRAEGAAAAAAADKDSDDEAESEDGEEEVASEERSGDDKMAVDDKPAADAKAAVDDTAAPAAPDGDGPAAKMEVDEEAKPAVEAVDADAPVKDEHAPDAGEDTTAVKQEVKADLDPADVPVWDVSITAGEGAALKDNLAQAAEEITISPVKELDEAKSALDPIAESAAVAAAPPKPAAEVTVVA